MTKHENGNVFLYILIAIALFAALSLVLTRGDGGGDESVLSQGRTQTTAQRLIGYVSTVSQAWLQMRDSGTDLTELSLLTPDDGTFNDSPTIHKLFHPDGGGVLYNAMDEDAFRASATTPVGWHFVKVQADWTATSGTDLVMTYVNVKADLCAQINKTVTGSTTIPSVTVSFQDTFVDGTTDLQESQCAECKTYPSLCVQNGGVYAFYNLIDNR